MILINNSFGPFGNSPLKFANFNFYYFITLKQVSIIKNLQLDKLEETFQVFNYYLMDENWKIYQTGLSSNIILLIGLFLIGRRHKWLWTNLLRDASI